MTTQGPEPDAGVASEIERLVDREHELREHHEGRGLDEGEARELHHLEVRLDQLWDLLRQRRARRRAGLDADDASVRGEATVEHYEQ
jgi:hypothetical protein